MTNTMTVNTTQPNAWLAQCATNPQARLRLFCFPYAGGGSVIYRAWADNLPTTVEVYPVELPGRGRRLREVPFTRLHHMVEAIAEALRPQLTKPFAFFGHSMGAVISFELARLLRQEYGLKPQHIFVSSRRAPQIPNDGPVTYNLPETEFLDDLRRLNGTPGEVLEHPELLQLVMPLLRSDFEVCQTYEYVPGPPLDCPITAFGGVLDPDVRREHMEAWREHTSAAFRLYMLSGDHFFIHSTQSLLLRTLAQEIHALTSRIAWGKAF
jgi:medium-chain acyl-[acyl-carrier-protein] hydrolase